MRNATRNGRRKRMTIETLAADCLDLRELQRRGLFGDGWVTCCIVSGTAARDASAPQISN
jgi:hypothetical protein